MLVLKAIKQINSRCNPRWHGVHTKFHENTQIGLKVIRQYRHIVSLCFQILEG
jgi:hypothetical protein